MRVSAFILSLKAEYIHFFEKVKREGWIYRKFSPLVGWVHSKGASFFAQCTEIAVKWTEIAFFT